MVKNYNSNSSSYLSFHPMSISGIQGQLLEVAAANKLKDTEWVSRQDPYVCLEYAHTKYRTRACTDGGKNPTFQERFMFTLIEGLLEFSVAVWNNNTIVSDAFIGNGRVQLHKVLSQGYDDSAWSIQDKKGRHAGEVRLIMHYANATRPATSSHAPSAPPFVGTPAPQVPPYSAPPLTSSYPTTVVPPYSATPLTSSYPPTTVVPPYSATPLTSSYPPTTLVPPSTSAYPPTTYPLTVNPPTLYPPSSLHPLYPPATSVYPSSQYDHQPAAYSPIYPPPQSVYPPIYPPPQSVYPPPPYPPGASSYPPPY